jgi:HlyD family secretion protein
LIESELKGVNALWEQHLVQFSRVTTLERDGARVLGERGALVSGIAQTKGKIAETELQILQVEQDMRTEVGKELAEIRGKTSEMMEKKSAAVDVLRRIDIKAPQNGVVYQNAFHTVGGVINPAEAIMMIVPEADNLTVEARIEPQKIDQVHVDQEAALHFSSFNQRTTPEINGVVVEVSPDLTQDTKTGVSYYRIRVGMTAQELARLGKRRLLPGMPVEVFIKTESRSMLSYLVKPLTDQIMKAFRET